MAKETRASLELLAENVISACKKLIARANFDRTSVGHMVKDNGDGTYDVNAFGKVYTLPYAGTINPRQVVYVKAPCNDFNNLYIERLG